MLIAIVGLVCVGIGLFGLALQRFYSCVPAKELKRLAARGDDMAVALYRPVAYGGSLRVLLWVITGTTIASGLLLTAYHVPPVIAFIVVAVTVLDIVLVQSLRLTVRSAKLAILVAPALTWLLSYLHAPLGVVAKVTSSFRNHTPHSGLYEKEDLVALLQQQKEQLDNRIAHHDLDLLEKAVHFDDRTAADIVQPMSRQRLVNMHEHLGPVLLDELHKSGQNSFLVYDGTPDKVIGTLFLRDAVHARDGGTVSDLMHARVCFVHEDFSLRQVLRAFARTSQFMVVVLNAFAEPVGVITLQQLLTNLIGERAEDDFDAFESAGAVAAFRPALQTAEVPIADDGPAPAEASPEPTEMVE